MASKIASILLALGLALPAMAQLDSYALRAKFGSPLSREVFHMPQGFDMVVDYGVSNQVCSVEVPALMPSHETVTNLTVQKQRMYAFLEEVVPAAMRGEKGQSFSSRTGLHYMLSTDYENVTVAESGADNPYAATITVRFKRSECQKREP